MEDFSKKTGEVVKAIWSTPFHVDGKFPAPNLLSLNIKPIPWREDKRPTLTPQQMFHAQL